MNEFHFNKDPKEENYIIRGIKTVQNSVDSKIKIVDGGFGKNQITVAVTLPEHDVESVVSFFGDVVHVSIQFLNYVFHGCKCF